MSGILLWKNGWSLLIEGGSDFEGRAAYVFPFFVVFVERCMNFKGSHMLFNRQAGNVYLLNGILNLFPQSIRADPHDPGCGNQYVFID